MGKKIIVVDPKSSIYNLMTTLRNTGWIVEEISSSNCEPTIVTNRSDIAFALSGSDSGISIAHKINTQLGLSESIDERIMYDKVAQYHFVHTTMPHLTFPETHVFNSKIALKNYLKNSQHNIVIRPSISFINGSAVLYQKDNHEIENAINHLFTSSNQVITHPFIHGTSYFINGIVFNGVLFITDAWRCFNIKANQRHILTSVISSPISNTPIINMTLDLQELCKKFGLRFSPIHFEVLLSDNTFKIIKAVPRIATEPLPTLCNLAGIKSQIDHFYSALSGHFTPPHRLDCEIKKLCRRLFLYS